MRIGMIAEQEGREIRFEMHLRSAVASGAAASHVLS